MRTWLLFGLGIGLAIAVMTFLERPPPRPARTLDVDFDLDLEQGATALPPAVPREGEAAAAALTAGPAVPLAPETAETPPVPSSLVVARIVDRARREPAAALSDALSLAELDLREAAVRAVLATWSPEYPAAATEHFEALSTYGERAAAAELFARVYAERDPFAALAWLRALVPPVTDAQKPLLAAIEALPPARAIEIVRETSGTADERAAAVGRLVATVLEIDPTAVRALANEALALPPTESAEELLAVLVGDWAAANAVAALEWLIEREDDLAPSVFMQAGFRIGARDPNAGASYADRMPLELRAAWVGAVANGYANVNPFGAADWIGRYTGDSAYPDAAVAVAEPLAIFDGPRAAALLEEVDPALPRYVNAAAGVGGNWARSDAQAAAEWVLRLPTREARARAIAAVAREWMTDDEKSAREWVLKLPSGSTRDRALAPFLTGDPLQTARDRVIVAAFSDWNAGTRALAEAREAFRVRQERDRAARERALERAQRGR